MSCCHEKAVIKAEKAPKPIGPYSAAIKNGHFVFVSGQTGTIPETGSLVEGGVEAETRQTLINIQSILEAAGGTLADVVKTTVFLREISEFVKMNAVYAEFFKEEPPARSTFQVVALPRNAAVEIEVIAVMAHCDCKDSDCCCKD